LGLAAQTAQGRAGSGPCAAAGRGLHRPRRLSAPRTRRRPASTGRP
jgi:hypothetical protein